ncbi:MAG: ATP-binding protein [Clostridiales bacterium]|nr:ATP-binding protein [Clostridiales bacterium]
MSAKPSIARIYSGFTRGTDCVISELEISVTPGIPTFSVIGLCDSSIRESHGRLISALGSAGFKMPKGHVTINISPAYMKKSGSGFDLAMAVGILFASGQLPFPKDKRVYAEGELSLDGSVKGTPGAALRLNRARSAGFEYVIFPEEERDSARCISASGQCVKSLPDACSVFGFTGYRPEHFDISEVSGTESERIDISMLKGQEKTKRAIILAAAGFHNMLLLGSPGSGKTMAAGILSGILPQLDPDETGEVYALYEALDGPAAKISTERPVRIISPDITPGKLLGNAVSMTPGEMALANHGVLFADEIMEYPSQILDLMRKPLEDREVRLFHNGVVCTYPAGFIFVGAGNPCKCGLFYEPGSRCRCTPGSRRRYMSRLSGPFIERIDIFSEMRSIGKNDMALMYADEKEAQSPVIKENISRCWEIQRQRYGKMTYNSCVSSPNIADSMRLSKDVLDYCSELASKGLFSARGYQKTLRLARTIADYDGRDDVTRSDVSEAAVFRAHEL